LLQTYVFSEVIKQAEWSDGTYTLHHYRDKDLDEVDIVIEDELGAIVGIEVKASATRGSHFVSVELTGSNFSPCAANCMSGSKQCTNYSQSPQWPPSQ
jgi:hypothetical protein